jgi:hypothetical protein
MTSRNGTCKNSVSAIFCPKRLCSHDSDESRQPFSHSTTLTVDGQSVGGRFGQKLKIPQLPVPTCRERERPKHGKSGLAYELRFKQKTAKTVTYDRDLTDCKCRRWQKDVKKGRFITWQTVKFSGEVVTGCLCSV